MRQRPPARPAAVCVIRAEPREDGTLLISVTATLDVNRRMIEAPHRVTDPARALQIVADFLRQVDAEQQPWPAPDRGE